jgi:glycine cleavage system H protein
MERHVRSHTLSHTQFPITLHCTALLLISPNHCDTNFPPKGTLGISIYAAKALGDVVYVELPELDMEVSEGDAIGAVESVKSASDILTPISGTVAEVNNDLEATPANINKDPEGESWIARITVSEEPKGKMMSAEEYKAFTDE